MTQQTPTPQTTPFFAPRRVRRWARLVGVLGVLVALLGLCGFWGSRDPQRTVLSTEERALVNPTGDFQVSFVLAGRDYDYDPAGPLVWRGGEQVRAYTTPARYGQHTDTIIYVNIMGSKVYMVSIPRDVYLPQHRDRVDTPNQAKINAVYTSGRLIYGGDDRAEHLRRAVGELLDLPIDYYVVVNIDIFKELVDALGGVEVDVPTRMYHRDQAAGLLIDLQPGLQHLDGEQASGFVRFRDTLRGDIDRIDNVKTLASALLERLKELNVRVAGRVPALVNTYFEQVETNIGLGLASRLVPLVGGLELQAATLPTQEVILEEGRGPSLRRLPALAYDPAEVEGFLAELFGGSARAVAEVPQQNILLNNRSGVPGLGRRVEAELVRMGVPSGRIRVRQGGRDPVSRVVTTHAGLAAAPFYADLLGVGAQQVDRLPGEDVEIILGQDARRFYLAAQPAAGG